MLSIFRDFYIISAIRHSEKPSLVFIRVLVLEIIDVENREFFPPKLIATTYKHTQNSRRRISWTRQILVLGESIFYLSVARDHKKYTFQNQANTLWSVYFYFIAQTALRKASS